MQLVIHISTSFMQYQGSETHEDGGRSKAPDLAFTHNPAACRVFCPLDLKTSPARERMGYFGHQVD